MKMQDFMQKIKEKKLKRSDWLILVLAGILILIIALPTDTKEKKQGILTLDSMQSTTSDDVKKGATYFSIMESNLSVLQEALQ